MSSRTLVLALATLLAPALAAAQPAPPPPVPAEPAPPAPAAPVAPPPAAPAPAPAPVAAPMVAPAPQPAVAELRGGPPDGWQLQARLPTNFGVDTFLSPGFSIGHRSGKIVIGAELGLTGGKLSTDDGMGGTNSEEVLLFQIVPMLYDDLWQSADGRARLNFVAGVGYGHGSVTSSSNDGMGNSSSSSDDISFLPLLAGVGGDYYLHPNFAIGVEFGAEVPILLSVTSGGADQHVSGALESARGLIRFTFVTGP